MSPLDGSMQRCPSLKVLGIYVESHETIAGTWASLQQRSHGLKVVCCASFVQWVHHLLQHLHRTGFLSVLSTFPSDLSIAAPANQLGPYKSERLCLKTQNALRDTTHSSSTREVLPPGQSQCSSKCIPNTREYCPQSPCNSRHGPSVLPYPANVGKLSRHLFCMLRAGDSRLHSTIVGLCCPTMCAARHLPHFLPC